MITGFNTDIEHNGVIYHVQTEDKGLETPLILSLVYNRGTILASKRSPYDDLVQNGFDEKVLTERLQKQHKLICAAIRAGRIEDLKQMTAKAAAAGKVSERENGSKPKVSAPAFKPIPKPEGSVNPVENGPSQPRSAMSNTVNFVGAPATRELNSKVRRSKERAAAPAIPAPAEELIWELPLQVGENDISASGGEEFEDSVISAEAVEIVSRVGSRSKTAQGALAIEFLKETTFKAGERKTLNIRVYRGKSEHFISSAQVLVKVLGSNFRPMIFHAKTDSNGIAIVHLQLPQFNSGRGAVLVRAISDGEEAELRQVIRQS